MAAVTDATGVAKVDAVTDELPSLRLRIGWHGDVVILPPAGTISPH